MADHEMLALLKRGKRSVATAFKGDCVRASGQQRIKAFLDYILNPEEKAIDDFDTLEWCRLLIAGGSTYDEFTKTVRQYDNAIMCGLVWTANFVAYRCRTCGISLCMSLCADCFHAGNHEGHDYNMFRSQAGGACDCGDVSVMKEEGFCHRHGPNNAKLKPVPPPDLLGMAKIMMPRVFLLRLIYHMRDNFTPGMKDTYLVSMTDAEHYLSFLHSLSDMGASMRKVMVALLLDPQPYRQLACMEGVDDSSTKYHSESLRKYLLAVGEMKYPKGFEKYEDMKGLSQSLIHDTFLDELVFWTVKFEFPQKVVTLLLSFLPDEEYKEAFTKSFIKHYSRISLVLVSALDRSTVANRVVHVSVQLFSNETLACKMVDEFNLLYILILSLNNMIENIVATSALQDSTENYHLVVECGHETMKGHCYWPIISDFINLLSHKYVAHKFMADNKLVNLWLNLLSYFQGMNLNQRELSQHVEYEPDTYYAAFSAELEIAASPMWYLISHLKTKETAEITKSMIKSCLCVLREWFNNINCKESTKPNPYQLTFHLPLHRYLATFLAQGVQQQEICLEDIVPPENMLKMLLLHLLQTQVSIMEIHRDMWVRNGLQIKGQAMTYIQCHFCYSMVDADIYLMQVCAGHLDPDFFVQSVLDRYHLQNWLSFSPNSQEMSFKMEPEHALYMLEGALAYFATLLGIKTYLGMSEKELTRLEMATLLCVNDRQHSQLMDNMPEKSGGTGHGKELFQITLEEISEYKSPNFEAGNGLQQGMYIPKDFVWDNEFDPVHVSLRAVHRKDFQSAIDRYTERMRQRGKYTGKSSPWPPFHHPGNIIESYKSMYRILHCKTMHAFLFTVLYKAVNESTFPDSVMYYCIHLLEMAVSIHNPMSTRKSTTFSGKVPDVQYMEWFSGSHILQNVRETIQDILVPVLEKEENVIHSEIDTESLEEMFQLSPSVLSSSNGPIPAAHSGHMPMITMVNSAGPVVFPIVPIHSIPSQTGIKQEKPRYESRGVSTERTQTSPVSVNESIISLLIKLHSKLSGKQDSYVPLSFSMRQLSTSRIGDGPHFIGKLLDRLSQKSTICAKQIEEVIHSLKVQDTTSTEEENLPFDESAKRRRAREKQQKLLAKFANKQKAFMEQTMETEEMESGDCESEKEKMEEEEYDCVICGQTTPSTSEKTMGLVILLQASSVLGHRLQYGQSRSLVLEEKRQTQYMSCARYNRNQLTTLMDHCEESSCQMSVNIGWEGGVLVQTCGHYLHLDCHNSYVTSLRTQNFAQHLALNKGEYRCPLCRQLANSVLPMVPGDSLYSLVQQVSYDPQQMVLDIAEMMIKRSITPKSQPLTKSMGSVMEDLTNATYGSFKTFTNSQTPESVLLFVCSVARTNLETELLQRRGSISRQSSVTTKQSFLPLIYVLSMHSKILTVEPYTDLWSHITGISCTEQSTSVSLYQKAVPLLLKDVTSLLIQLVLTLPTNMEREHFAFLVKMLYNVVFVQALTVMSCKFTKDEREAWRKKGRSLAFESMEGVMSSVITKMELSRLYEEAEVDNLPAICQTVWSPQSVDVAVQEFCIHYLQIAALLKSHLFQEDFPENREDLTEFQYLCSYLELNRVVRQTLPPAQLTSILCVHWVAEEPLGLTRAWCGDLVNFVNIHPIEGKSLLLVNQVWMPPSLIVLPDYYYRIFQSYRNRQCTICSAIPKDPAVCLMCGQYLCFRDFCCQQQNLYECVHHSIECGAGTGIFLLVNSSIVVVIRGPRATLWGSVYLDEHGEEDRDLKRGKPLYLSKERYQLLEQQWTSHTFDQVCKRWIWHQDRL
ncbi:hypothetical protein ScPMuIL_015371 [Solemya velum]